MLIAVRKVLYASHAVCNPAFAGSRHAKAVKLPVPPLFQIDLMSGNSFGKLFTVTTFGESHGPAIGCVIDGCPPGMLFAESDIQPELDRRKPGTSRHVTQRQEADRVQILSGVYEG